MPPERLLVIEDDPAVRTLLERTLAAPGREVECAANGAAARRAIEANPPQVVMLDLGLPDVQGTELLKEILDGDRRILVIVLTGRADQPSVIESMKRGAMEYVLKPFDPDSLAALVSRAFRRHSGDVPAAAAPVQADAGEGALVGRSPLMVEVFKLIGVLAGSDVPVLVSGETGTGKELVARSLHRYSASSGGPFVVADCGSLPGGLLEAELFGHEKGAFTGADAARAGRFEQANGGTLFLDEVGNIPLEVQPKLLRALQERTAQRLGSTRPYSWQARVVSATNANLAELARQGKFRDDLLFRLAGAEIPLPSLRQRLEDLPLLVAHFLSRGGRRPDPPTLSAGAMEILLHHDWPGNVRELQHVLERASALARGRVIDEEHLPERVRGGGAEPSAIPALAAPRSREEVVPLDSLKRRYARQVLELCGGNKSEAARLLGIDRGTLYELLG